MLVQRSSMLVAAWCAAALAQADVLTVGPGELHAEINSAIAAAADGDLILVAPGHYPDLDVPDKSISVVGLEGGPVVVRTSSGTSVSGLSAGRTVVLANLTIQVLATAPSAPTALSVVNCAGSVRIHASAVLDERVSAAAKPAVAVLASDDVVLTGCELRGGEGAASSSGDGAFGGPGLLLDGASRAAVYDSTLRGGDGGEQVGNGCFICVGGDGGDGAELGVGCFLFCSGAELLGGTGGPGWCCSGADGRSVRAWSSSQAKLLDCLAATTVGDVQVLPGRSHRLAAYTIGPHHSPLRFSVRGQPGDEVYLLRSHRPLFEDRLATLNGVLAVDVLAWSARPVGVLAGDVMVFYEPIGALPPGVENGRLFFQAVVRSAGGLTASSPVSVDVLR